MNLHADLAREVIKRTNRGIAAHNAAVTAAAASGPAAAGAGSGPGCTRCGRSIEASDSVELKRPQGALPFHKACFVCDSCKAPLKPTSAVPVNGGWFCDRCGRQAFINSVKK